MTNQYPYWKVIKEFTIGRKILRIGTFLIARDHVQEQNCAKFEIEDKCIVFIGWSLSPNKIIPSKQKK